MGNSFIEAMAAGLPVIGTNEGGIKDFLFDSERNTDREPTGWVVDPDAPEQVAEKVTAIVSDDEARAIITARARALVAKEYDWEHVVRQMRGILERATKGARMGV